MTTAARPSVRDTAARVRASALCLVGWLIAASAWCIGARYTVDGALVLSSWLLRFIGAPLVLGPAAWWLYLTLAPLPLYYSFIEWGDNPAQLVRREGWSLSLLGSVCVWLLVAGMDAATTYVGLDAAPAGSSDVLRFFFDSAGGLILATAFLTFWPEWLARVMLARWQTIWR